MPPIHQTGTVLTAFLWVLVRKERLEAERRFTSLPSCVLCLKSLCGQWGRIVQSRARGDNLATLPEPILYMRSKSVFLSWGAEEAQFRNFEARAARRRRDLCALGVPSLPLS